MMQLPARRHRGAWRVRGHPHCFRSSDLRKVRLRAVDPGRMGEGADEARRVRRASPTADGRIRFVWGDERAKVILPVFDQWRRTRPGSVDRNEGKWKAYLLDRERDRRGASRRCTPSSTRTATARPTATRGTASARAAKANRTRSIAREVIALDAEVEAALLAVPARPRPHRGRRSRDATARQHPALAPAGPPRLPRHLRRGLLVDARARHSRRAHGAPIRNRGLARHRRRRRVPAGRCRGRTVPARRVPDGATCVPVERSVDFDVCVTVCCPRQRVPRQRAVDDVGRGRTCNRYVRGPAQGRPGCSPPALCRSATPVSDEDHVGSPAPVTAQRPVRKRAPSVMSRANMNAAIAAHSQPMPSPNCSTSAPPATSTSAATNIAHAM